MKAIHSIITSNCFLSIVFAVSLGSLNAQESKQTPLLSIEKANVIRYSYPQVYLTLKNALSKLADVKVSDLRISDASLGRNLNHLQVASTAYLKLKEFSTGLSEKELNQEGRASINADISKVSVTNLLLEAGKYFESNGLDEKCIVFMARTSDVETEKEIVLKRLLSDVHQ